MSDHFVSMRHCTVESRLANIDENEIPILRARTGQWPPSLQRLAEHIWTNRQASKKIQKAPNKTWSPVREPIWEKPSPAPKWIRPSAKEIEPYVIAVEKAKHELETVGRIARAADIQKLAFRRMRN
jgi:hypothetical protein